MPDAPPTAEGWYVSHDLRRVDWAAWREADDDTREAALDSARKVLEDDSDAEGATAIFAMLGDRADLLILRLRPTLNALEQATRVFDRTAFSGFTDRIDSFTSVTEVSGYVSQAYFEEGEAVDPGLADYIETKLKPTLPDGFISFYPMSKRRHPEDNWYTLSFEERAEMMAEHGETGRSYAGEIQQMITSAMGFDDYEWGVTLFGQDPAAIKDVVYEMRFDEASARFAEFGPFYVGRRFPPSDLGAYMAGETVPTGTEDAESHTGPPRPSETDDVLGGAARGDEVHARVVFSTADPAELASATEDLRSDFDHYDTHQGTVVYERTDGGGLAVVSRWATADAADIAAGFLADLPEASDEWPSLGAHADGGSDSADDAEWGTMGMFYTVKPDRREAFLARFEDVQALLRDVEGHRGTSLFVNREDARDLFIASRWRDRDDAMTFFRSDAFADTVSWGRDVLADSPQHVYLDR